MNQEKHSAFLDRQAYRERRLADGARMLPLFGSVLLCLPLLWALSEAGATPTTYVMTFLFVAWLGLIIVAAYISARLPKGSETNNPSKDE